MSALLELHGVSKRFGAVQALDGVDFALSAGEVVGLVGDNGAGKSTLVKVISGIYDADAGEYRFEGAVRTRDRARTTRPRSASRPSTRTSRCATTSTSSPTCSSGARSCRAGRRGALRELDEAGMEKQAGELLQTLTVKLPSVRQEVGTLSGGQRQSVAIARSLIGEAKVVLLDEPTAALGVAQTEQVLALIRRLREQGLGVVVISHNLADVFSVVDRIVVLRLGRNAGDFAAADTSREEVVSAITGAEFGGNGAGRERRRGDEHRGGRAGA